MPKEQIVYLLPVVYDEDKPHEPPRAIGPVLHATITTYDLKTHLFSFALDIGTGKLIWLKRYSPNWPLIVLDSEGRYWKVVLSPTDAKI